MTDYTDIEAKLAEYSEVFDRYMDCGNLPPEASQDDCLIRYIKDVIDHNPQLDNSDPTWVEVLKDHLLSYLSALLEEFQALQLEAMKEQELITRFSAATIEEKRKMWPEVRGTIEEEYSKYEVNIGGYTAQFKTEDREAVFAALTNNWTIACEAKLKRRIQQIFEGSKDRFENICQEVGSTDYEKRKKLDNYFYRYPQLKTIVDKIGRENESSTEEKDSVIYKFLPSNLNRQQIYEELDRIELGDNVERVLPIELSMPDGIFFKRFVTKELQQFSSPSKDRPRKQEEKSRDPRLTKGPIIVSVDTSASMDERPMKIAFSLLKQLIDMAKKQKRACFLITFSVRAHSIDLSKPANWNVLNQFLENGFSGGTDGEEMLAEALRVLKSGTYEIADVLIISDLEFPAPEPLTMESINKEKSLGTKFYALHIGYQDHDYKEVFDTIWNV